jgi:hypothetical protein
MLGLVLVVGGFGFPFHGGDDAALANITRLSQSSFCLAFF